jgi:hypothetical protein
MNDYATMVQCAGFGFICGTSIWHSKHNTLRQVANEMNYFETRLAQMRKQGAGVDIYDAKIPKSRSHCIKVASERAMA